MGSYHRKKSLASYAAINVMPEVGGGPRDEVGALYFLAHPTWGILAIFGHKCCPRDLEV